MVDARDFIPAWCDRLRSRMTATGTKAADVAALLHIGESSLRKRFRGEVPFSAEEFVLLSDKFDLPRSAAELSGKRLDLYASAEAGGAFDEEAYIRGLHQFTEQIVRDAKGAISELEVSICAADLPIHQLLGNPVLTATKLYFFDTRSGVDIMRRFDLNEALERQRPLFDLAAEIHDTYRSINSVEVWGRDPIGSFLHQITKLARAHAISEADLKIVFSHLRALVERIGKEASQSRKSGGGRFELYQNWLFANKTIMLVETPPVRYSFLTIANPHFLYSTSDESFAFFGANAEAFRQQSVKVSGTEAINGGRFEEALARGIDRAELAIATFREAESMF